MVSMETPETEPLSVVVERALVQVDVRARFGDPVTERHDLDRVLSAIEIGSDVEQAICEYVRVVWEVSGRVDSPVGQFGEYSTAKFVDAADRMLLAENGLDVALADVVGSPSARMSAVRTIAQAVYGAGVKDRSGFRLSLVVGDAAFSHSRRFNDTGWGAALDAGPVQIGADGHAVDLIYEMTECVLALMADEQAYQQTADIQPKMRLHRQIADTQQVVDRVRGALVERLSVRYPDILEAVEQVVGQIILSIRATSPL